MVQLHKLMSIAITLRRLPLLVLMMAQGCHKDPETCPNPGTGQDDTSYMALLDILEDASASTGQITTNSGFLSIYSLSIAAQPGDLLRIRCQVEMTNDTFPFEPDQVTTTIRGHIRLMADGNNVGNLARQNNVADPLDAELDHHMHHMPLWADAFVHVDHSGQTLIEAQYATSRSGLSPIVKIEPWDGGSPYGHLVVEHYRSFASREEAQAFGASGLHALLSDDVKDISVFDEDAAAYHFDCDVEPGDVLHLFGQATGRFVDNLALHGQKVCLNNSRISPFASENIVSLLPGLPLWTDAVHHASSSQTDVYSLNLHSLEPLGSAEVDDAGYLYGLHFRKLLNSSTSRQLVSVETVTGPTSDFPVVANTGWHSVAFHQGSANAGDVLRATGFVQLSAPDDLDDGVNCYFRLLVNGSEVYSSKYITPRLEMLPLRTEQLLMVPSTGTFTVEAEVKCTHNGTSLSVDVVGGLSGIILERFGE